MSTRSPLKIPELRGLVARHLDRPSLQQASLVCKDWHPDFTRALWRSYRVVWKQDHHCSSKNIVDSASPIHWLKQHVQHVRYLTYPYYEDEQTDATGALLKVLVDHCHGQLERLALAPIGEQRWRLFTRLCRNSAATLTHLTLTCDVYGVSEDRYALFRALPNLKTLDIYFDYLSPLVDMVPLVRELAQLQHLETLILRNWHVSVYHTAPRLTEDDNSEGSDSPSPRLPSLQIKHLVLDDVRYDSHTFHLLRRCPHLEHFACSGRRLPYRGDEIGPVTLDLCKVIQEFMPRLASLELDNWWWSTLDNNGQPAATHVLQNLPEKRIRHLIFHSALNITDIYPPPAPPLIPDIPLTPRVLTSLVSLQFNGFQLGPHVNLAPIFQQCPQLVSLKIDRGRFPLTADLVQHAWVCNQLEILQLPVYIRAADALEVRWPAWGPCPPTDKAIAMERMLLERLALLTKLRQLRLGPKSHSDCLEESGDQCLMMRLETGLDLLEKLNLLWELDLGCAPYEQDVEELQWMQQHWPSLLALACDRLRCKERRWLTRHWPELRVLQLRPYA